MTISIKIKMKFDIDFIQINLIFQGNFCFLFANICVHVFGTYFRDTYRKK